MVGLDGLVFRLDELEGIYQPEQFYDSMFTFISDKGPLMTCFTGNLEGRAKKDLGICTVCRNKVLLMIGIYNAGKGRRLKKAFYLEV